MATTSTAPAAAAAPVTSDERWTRYSATVLTICILGWAFDIYEATIMQLVTPILIKEWGITPATMGIVTTISRWVGLIGTFAFPVLADLYGRKPVLIWSILGYSILTGLTGFSTGWITLLIFSSLTRIALAGENPVGMLLVTETAPKKWRATALGGLVGGYPLGYMLCSLAALVVVPLWGWRALYFLGILPALLVLWVRHRHQGKPALRARHRADAQGGAEEAARHLRRRSAPTRARASSRRSSTSSISSPGSAGRPGCRSISPPRGISASRPWPPICRSGWPAPSSPIGSAAGCATCSGGAT